MGIPSPFPTPPLHGILGRAMKPHWKGVFPAITTQMHKDGSLDVEATAVHADVLIRSGVTGLVFLGSLGENQSMTGEIGRAHV